MICFILDERDILFLQHSSYRRSDDALAKDIHYDIKILF